MGVVAGVRYLELLAKMSTEQGEKGGDQENVVSSSSEETAQQEDQPPRDTSVNEATPDTTQETPQPQQSTVPPTAQPPRVRHDWYQTQSDVYVNVMIKRLKRENVRVEFGERRLRVEVTLGEGETHTLTFSLAHKILVEKSSYKVLSTKVEVKMRKCEGLQWAKLEGQDTPTDNPHPQMEAAAKDVADIHKYPSSSHYTRDWDKLAAEVKEEEKSEKLEGDAALNQLFQKIYKDGSEETQRAMNKSFMESGGTVLSTNWGEVGQKEMERKPPDGMEWKKYDV